MPPRSSGFVAIAGAGIELRAVGTLTELPSQGRDCHLAPEVFCFAAIAGAGTELRAVGTLIELPSRGRDCHRAPSKLALLPSCLT